MELCRNERLLSLSQFVSEIEKLIPNPFWESQLLAIKKYNEFLKQPLKKEMFMDEEKRIFNGEWRGRHDYSYNIHSYYVIGEQTVFEFYDDDTIDFTDEYGSSYSIETLHDLAEVTKGKLIIKI